MMDAATRLDEVFDPVHAATPRDARRAIGAFAEQSGADRHTLAAIRLCVTEAVANVVVHAYRDGDPGPAIVACFMEDATLWVRVRDRGCGLMPRTDSRGAGLGLPLIAQSAAESDVRTHPHGGTEVSMRFDRRGRGPGTSTASADPRSSGGEAGLHA